MNPLGAPGQPPNTSVPAIIGSTQLSSNISSGPSPPQLPAGSNSQYSSSGNGSVYFQPPSRPDQGTDGRTIQLKANHFEIVMPKGFLHHYDITITPEKCPRRVNRDIIQAMVNNMHYQKYFYNQKPVFDGRRNMYTREPLSIGKEKVGR